MSMREEDVQQLAEVIAEALDGVSVDGSKRWDQPAEQDFLVARAVLASRLVVPTSDVLGLAQHFETRDHLPRWYAAAELRALIDHGRSDA